MNSNAPKIQNLFLYFSTYLPIQEKSFSSSTLLLALVDYLIACLSCPAAREFLDNDKTKCIEVDPVLDFICSYKYNNVGINIQERGPQAQVQGKVAADKQGTSGTPLKEARLQAESAELPQERRYDKQTQVEGTSEE